MPLHARPLAKNTLLNYPATDLVTDDRRSPLGKLAGAQNPSPPAPPRLHAISREEEGHAPSDLDRTAAYRFGRARPGQAVDLGRPGQRPPPRSALLFFSKSIFPFCKMPARFKNV
jgi:hypothetical protein